MIVFGVSAMTVNSWRKGSVTRSALPATKIGNHVVFDVGRVERWAKTYGIPIMVEPKALRGLIQVIKPGPKARVEVSAKTPRKAKVPATGGA